MRCLARRRAPMIPTPSSRLANSWVEGCSTSEESRTSARSIFEPATSSRRSSFMVSTSGSSGIGVFIPAWHRLILSASCRFTRDEGGVALRELEGAVRSHRPNPEAHPFEFCGQIRWIVQPHAVHLFVPPVVLPHLPETHDPTLHRTPTNVLLTLGEHGPVFPHAETPRLDTPRHLARTKHVEDEDAAGGERLINVQEKAAKPPFLVLRVEKVVEDLTDRRNRGARRDLDLEERAHPELGLGRPAAGELDHRLGDVYAEDAVSGVQELARPQTATATEVDDKSIAYPVTVEDLQYARRRFQGELGVTDVVDVRDILPVPPARIITLRSYLSPL